MIEEEILNLFTSKGLTLSVAESCTGGQISHLITRVSGASKYYLGSVTSYAISIKENVLGVPAEVISKNGVVSSAVAEAMAIGVRQLTGSDYAVATTGLAGPGGDENNPEGTVWIGVASKQNCVSFCKHFNLGREANIKKFADEALNELKTFVLKEIN